MASLSTGAVQADAVFVSGLQRCDEPSARQVRQAVAESIRAFGYPGCTGLMEERMIQAQVMAARLACARMTARHLRALQDSVERACGAAGGSEWDRKAAAHAEIFGLLADVAGDPVLAPALRGGAGYVRELMVAVGRVAGGMTVSSRRRLLAHLRAGDGEGAALEMERHLRVLHYMGRLARRPAEAMGHTAP